MHRDLLIVGAAVAALAVAACNRQDSDVPPEQATMPDANAVATIATPADESAAPDFVLAASNNDLFEVAAAKLALDHAKSAEVKAFAKDMVAMHGQASRDLKAAAEAAGQTLVLSKEVPEDQQKKLDELAVKTGADFDKAYMEMQVDAHQDALNLLQRYAMDGDRVPLKTFASNTGAVVQKHFDKAVALRDSLK